MILYALGQKKSLRSVAQKMTQKLLESTRKRAKFIISLIRQEQYADTETGEGRALLLRLSMIAKLFSILTHCLFEGAAAAVWLTVVNATKYSTQ